MHDLRTGLADYLDAVVERIDAEDIVAGRPGSAAVRVIAPDGRTVTHRRGLVYAVAAALVVLLAIGGVALLREVGSDPSADVTTDVRRDPSLTEAPATQPEVGPAPATQPEAGPAPADEGDSVSGSVGAGGAELAVTDEIDLGYPMMVGGSWADQRIAVEGDAIFVGRSAFAIEPGPIRNEPGGLLRLDTTGRQVSPEIDMPAGVVAVAASGGDVWALLGDATLVRLYRETMKVAATVDTTLDFGYELWTPGWTDMWIGGGGVWIVGGYDASVVRIDEETLDVERHTVEHPNDIRPDVVDGAAMPLNLWFWLGEYDGALWAYNGRFRTVVSIDIETREIAKWADTGESCCESTAVMVDGGIWIAGRRRYDIATDSFSAINPSGVYGVFANGGVWGPASAEPDPESSETDTQDLVRWDAATGDLTDRIASLEGYVAHSIVTADGVLWVSAGDEVLRVDTALRTVTHRIETGASGELVAVDDAIWLFSEDGTARRIAETP